MLGLRKAAVIGALLVFWVMILGTGPTRGLSGPDPAYTALLRLVGLIAFCIGGLCSNSPWARWLALGAALAVAPWAIVLFAGGPTNWPATLLLAASLTILLLLTGDGANRAFGSGSALSGVERRRRRLLEWTIVGNIAAILLLYLFGAAYDFSAGWHQGVTVGLFAAMLAGVVALGRGKTAGLIVVALSCLALIPAATAFVVTEATHPGEAVLLFASLAPGLVTGLVSLCVFGEPMWRVLRS